MTTDSVTNSVCPDFKLLAVVEAECTKQFSCVVQFSSIFGDTRSIWIKRADFDEAKLLTATLKNSGAEFSLDDDVNAEAINQLIANRATAEKWKISASTGWRNGNNQFVLPYDTIGAGDPGVRILPPGAEDDTNVPKLGRGGTLRGWRIRVAKPARHSSRMVLGICAAFAATLLKSAGLNSFGVQISGPPKTAKSTGLLAAASVTGFSREKDLPNFRATEVALGELPAGFNDSLFPLNELALLKGNNRARQERMRDLAYGVAEGAGTTYSKFFSKRAALQWNTIAFANSEESVEELAQKVGATRTGGEAIRWIDLAAVRKGRMTIFDLAPAELFKGDEAKWAKDTCRKMRKAIMKNHGLAICGFIERVLEQREHIIGDLDAKSRLFIEDVSRKYDSPPVKHIASSFAHIYAGGALAVELGILPWKHRLVLKCVKRCYFDAKRSMRTPEDLQRSGLIPNPWNRDSFEVPKSSRL